MKNKLLADNLLVFTADWQQYISALKEIRMSVFIDEQKVPIELEWDEFDDISKHFLVQSNNVFIATGRLKPDGQIGRMAVLKCYRGQGVGSKLLNYIIQEAKDSGLNKVYCHAQVNAINFYQSKNFVPYGKEFEDANIPHQAMLKNLCY